MEDLQLTDSIEQESEQSQDRRKKKGAAPSATEKSPKPSQPLADEKVALIAVNTIEHDGKRYLPGETLEVSVTDSELLIGGQYAKKA